MPVSGRCSGCGGDAAPVRDAGAAARREGRGQRRPVDPLLHAVETMRPWIRGKPSCWL
jgi:hypothetical protein